MRSVVKLYSAGAAGRLLGALGAVLLLSASPAAAQLTTPLHIGTPDVLTDEFGVRLEGNALLPPSACDYVQAYWASNQVIYPPAYDGTPDPRNAPLLRGTSFIGNLVAHDLANPGFFSIGIATNRPGNNSYIFVRAFNAPTATGASFYADSQLMRVRNNNVLQARFTAATNAIDPRDPDGDGLNNSWEKSMDSDPDDPDSDDDGMIDGHEFRAGTGLNDPTSLLIATQVRGQAPAGGGGKSGVVRFVNAIVSWQSVAGKQYQLQYTTNNMVPDPIYVDLYDVVTATGPETAVVVPDGLLDGMRHYRVKLVE